MWEIEKAGPSEAENSKVVGQLVNISKPFLK
jgi:hypothetical protein